MEENIIEANVKNEPDDEVEFQEPEAEPLDDDTLQHPVGAETTASSTNTVQPPLSKPQYPCSICSNSYSSGQSLKFHLVKQHSEHPSVTSDPKFDLILQQIKERAVRQKRWKAANPGPKNHQCPHCSKKFPSPSSLHRHLTTTHSNERPYTCKKCENKFKTEDSLVRHTGSQYCHPSSIPKNLKCLQSDCDRWFDSRGALRNHMRRYHGLKVHQVPEFERSKNTIKCPECDSMLKSQDSLRAHKRKFHGSERSNVLLICIHCPYSTYDSHSLKVHSAIHTREWVCKDCFEIFNCRLNLQQHVCLSKRGAKLAEQIRLHLQQQEAGTKTDADNEVVPKMVKLSRTSISNEEDQKKSKTESFVSGMEMGVKLEPDDSDGYDESEFEETEPLALCATELSEPSP